MVTKSQLAIALSKLKTFIEPDASLEQYPVDTELAASILWKCYMDGVLKAVADLGAGTGILGLGAALLGAKKVYLVDIDKKALELAKQNQTQLEADFGVKLPVVYVNKSVKGFNLKVDTVIQNPPFGVQNEHADRIFLESAMGIADNIYTLHKAESKQFIDAFAHDNGFSVREMIFAEFPLKSSMRFHTQRIKILKVAWWILKREN